LSEWRPPNEYLCDWQIKATDEQRHLVGRLQGKPPRAAPTIASFQFEHQAHDTSYIASKTLWQGYTALIEQLNTPFLYTQRGINFITRKNN
jgi:hypothetical protein